jgi:hypothetical protein
MTAIELLSDLQRQGFTLIPLPEGKLAVKPADRITDDLRQYIRQCKAEVVALLTRPHISARGELIIPCNSDRRYHWWDGGQSIRETLRELGASPDVIARYVDSDSTLKVRQ